MQRYDFFFRQKVEEGELDAAFAAVEDAINRSFTDLSVIGIVAGFDIAQQGSPNLTVQSQGPGVAYDQLGQRTTIAATQNVDCSVDENALNTAVATPGNSRWLSIFVEFDRTLTDPRLDGNAITVYYNRAESFVFHVGAGAESGSPSRPALRGDMLLLADVLLTYGQTTITTSDISITRRQDAFVIADTPRSISARTIKAALTQLLGYYNDHVTGAIDPHPAGGIAYGGGGAWADGTTNPSTNVETQLDKIITDLALAVGTAGAKRIGMIALTQGWYDGALSASGNVYDMFNTIVAILALDSPGADGARRIGLTARADWADTTANPATSISAGIGKIVSDLADITATSGALKIGIDALGTWADATPSGAAGPLRTAVAKIVSDLAASTGTAKVGGAALGSVGIAAAAGTLASQMTAVFDHLLSGSILASMRTEILYNSTTAKYYNSIDSTYGTVLAAGDGGEFIYSLDEGRTWTTGTTGSASLRKVRYDTVNSIYVIVGDSGEVYTAPGAGPTALTLRTSGVVTQLANVMVGGPIRFIAVGATATVITSPDGVTWTTRTFGGSANLYAIGGNGALAIVGDGTTVKTSPDGITWTSRSVTSGMTTNAIAYNATAALYIVGQGTNVSSAGRLHTSPDGITWTLRDSPTDAVFHLASSTVSATVVAGCADGQIKYSLNGGVTWVRASLPAAYEGRAAFTIYSMEYDTNRRCFLAGCLEGVLLKSANGIRWEIDRAGSGATGQITDLVYNAQSAKTMGVNPGGFGSGADGSYIIATS